MVVLMRIKYTDEHIDFLRIAYPYLTVGSLTRAFNVIFGMSATEAGIKSTLKRNSIRSERRPKLFEEERKLRIYTPEQAEFIRNNYSGHSVAALTMLFNDRFSAKKTVKQIKAFVKNRGIKSGRTGQFEEGHQPHNKGIKGWQAGGNAAKTQFKPGQRGSKWVPIGSQRISKDGILQRKVTDTGSTPRDWKSVHSLLWEQHHGPIPDGYVVIFRNGNRQDIRIDNLAIVSRAELLRLNKHGYRQSHDDLKPSIMALSKLEVKTFSAKNDQPRKEHSQCH